MIKNIQMVAAALVVLASGYALADVPPDFPFPMPLPMVQDPSGSPVSPNLDPRACEQFLVEPNADSACGAVGGGGRIAFKRVVDGTIVDSSSCSFAFVNDSRRLMEKAEFPYILTSSHCVKSTWDFGSTEVLFDTEDGGSESVRSSVEVLEVDDESDLALLKFKTEKHFPTELICLNPLAPVPANDGAKITGYGMPPEGHESFNGEVLGRVRWSYRDSVVQGEGYQVRLSKGRAIPGWSGGGVYDQRGRYIGAHAASDERCDIRYIGALHSSGEVLRHLEAAGYENPTYLVDRGRVPRVSALMLDFDPRRWVYDGSALDDLLRKGVRRIGGRWSLGRYYTRGDQVSRNIDGYVNELGSSVVVFTATKDHSSSDTNGPPNPAYWVSELDLGRITYPFGQGAERYHRLEVPRSGGVYVGVNRGLLLSDIAERMNMELLDSDRVFIAKASSGGSPYGAAQLTEFLSRGTYYVKLIRGGGMGLGDDDDEYEIAATIGGTDETARHPMFLPPSDARMGFVRIINNEDEHAFVEIARKNEGREAITAVLTHNEGRHFNALDLQDGNPEKQIPYRDAWGVLATDDPWSLESRTAWDVDVHTYTRTADGMVSPIGAQVPLVKGGSDGMDDLRDVFFFNPASNYNQRSTLRISNLIHPANVTVRIEGTDDVGNVSNVEVSLYDNDWSTVTLTAADLEEGTGPGVSGALGDGIGKWRLRITADPEPTADAYKERAVASVMNLLESPTGHLINLSDRPSQPSAAEAGKVVKDIPLFLAVSEDRMGFLRLANGSVEAAQVKLTAIKEDGSEAGSLWVPLAPNEARHFNARDLQEGNAAKGIAEDDSFGELEDGENWRLRLESESRFEAQSYSRTSDGLVADTTQVVAHHLDGDQEVHRIAFFNPGSNNRQRSLLQVTNLMHPDAVTLHVEGMDDAGSVSSLDIRLEERETITLSAADLEQGMGRGVTGALHDGQGKWRLKLTTDSEEPAVRVMNLLESPTGHLINLSD